MKYLAIKWKNKYSPQQRIYALLSINSRSIKSASAMIQFLHWLSSYKLKRCNKFKKISMYKPEETVRKIREDAMEDTKSSRELGIKFFFHWALLSGAALTLLIPFLSSEIVQKNITRCSKFYIGVASIAFVVSLISASIRNFIMMRLILNRAQINHKIANELSKAIREKAEYKTDEQKEEFKLILNIAQYTAIFSFIIGIIAAYIFISIVIF